MKIVELRLQILSKKSYSTSLYSVVLHIIGIDVVFYFKYVNYHTATSSYCCLILKDMANSRNHMPQERWKALAVRLVRDVTKLCIATQN